MFLGIDRVRPLVLDSREDLIVLPLSSGQQYQLFTVATDNVGNQESLSEAMANMKTANYPSIVGVCPNNCSNRGNCTELSSCRCYPGFYGSDCSQGKCIISTFDHVLPAIVADLGSCHYNVFF